MSPPNTDPWTAPVAPETGPGVAPATTVDESDASVTRVDASVTRELAPSPFAATPPRQAASGTDPGLGNPTRAPDTIMDAAEPGAHTSDDDTTWDEDGPTDDGLAAHLEHFGGRPQQHAAFQADSAGRYAASYDVVAKPVKSRAVSRTDPFGVIVAPDTLPPAPVKRDATEPMIVAAVAVVPMPAAPSLPAAAPAQRSPSPLGVPTPADVTPRDLAVANDAPLDPPIVPELVTIIDERSRPSAGMVKIPTDPRLARMIAMASPDATYVPTEEKPADDNETLPRAGRRRWDPRALRGASLGLVALLIFLGIVYALGFAKPLTSPTGAPAVTGTDVPAPPSSLRPIVPAPPPSDRSAPSVPASSSPETQPTVTAQPRPTRSATPITQSPPPARPAAAPPRASASEPIAKPSSPTPATSPPAPGGVWRL